MQSKFDAIDYLVKKYVDDGEHATIPIILKKKTDFFNKFDPTQTSIEPDIYHYLDKCAYHIPLQYKIRIDVVCNEMDDETKVKIEEAVKNHYGLKSFNDSLDLKANNRKAMILTALGLIFVLVSYLWDNINLVNQIVGTVADVFRELIVVAGWVFIWSACENIIFDRRKLRTDKNENIQMFNAQFIFENENEYYKILKEEEQEIPEDNEDYEEIRDSFLEQ